MRSMVLSEREATAQGASVQVSWSAVDPAPSFGNHQPLQNDDMLCTKLGISEEGQQWVGLHIPQPQQEAPPQAQRPSAAE